MSNLISRQALLDKFEPWLKVKDYNDGELNMLKAVLYEIRFMRSAQPEIIRCKDCKYWNSGSCEYREHAVNCDGYSVGDIETEAEHFCGYAERRKVTT